MWSRFWILNSKKVYYDSLYVESFLKKIWIDLNGLSSKADGCERSRIYKPWRWNSNLKNGHYEISCMLYHPRMMVSSNLGPLRLVFHVHPNSFLF